MGRAPGHRDFPGKRWVVNLLRAAHLVGVVGVGAGMLAAWPPAHWQPYAVALLASGLAILFVDWWSNPRYLLQVKGLSVLVKLALAGWLAADPARLAWLFWTLLILSVLIAHAPGSLRHREVF